MGHFHRKKERRVDLLPLYVGEVRYNVMHTCGYIGSYNSVHNEFIFIRFKRIVVLITSVNEVMFSELSGTTNRKK